MQGWIVGFVHLELLLEENFLKTAKGLFLGLVGAWSSRAFLGEMLWVLFLVIGEMVSEGSHSLWVRWSRPCDCFFGTEVGWLFRGRS